jgi:hypothetical protein
MPDDVLAAVALLGGDTRLLDQRPAALVPSGRCRGGAGS